MIIRIRFYHNEILKIMNMRYRDLGVFGKAEEIVEITSAIIASFRDDVEENGLIAQLMMENALRLPAKIANAEGGDIYSHRLDNAVLIKLAARELNSQTYLCKQLELTDPVYLRLLRTEIETFRHLFLDWVDTFDPTNDIVDEWNFRLT